MKLFNQANPFNLKTILALNIQMFAGDPPPVDPTPPNPEPNPNPPNNDPGTTLSLESVQAWLNEQEDGKKWLQSFSDSRVTEAIKTYESKTLPKKLEEEINKRYPPTTEEQKKILELQQQMEKFQSEAQREKLTNTALSKATEDGLPTSLVAFFVGQDEETTVQNLGVLKSEFDAAVQKAVDARFAAGGPHPPKPQDNNTLDAQIEAARQAAQKNSTPENRARYAELKAQKFKMQQKQ